MLAVAITDVANNLLLVIIAVMAALAARRSVQAAGRVEAVRQQAARAADKVDEVKGVLANATKESAQRDDYIIQTTGKTLKHVNSGQHTQLKLTYMLARRAAEKLPHDPVDEEAARLAKFALDEHEESQRKMDAAEAAKNAAATATATAATAVVGAKQADRMEATGRDTNQKVSELAAELPPPKA